MYKKLFATTLLISSISFTLIAQTIENNWESIDSRHTPQWFTDAKFGVFIHWGVYSVPAYRPADNGDFHGVYAEWYGPDVLYKPWRNDSFHIKNYGADFEYRDFAPMFRAELWQPTDWAKTIKASGAKYVVLTTKHSDGYALWPTEDPTAKNWNSADIGPKRDIVGELTDAIRNENIRMGFYYSWLEYESVKTTWPHDPRFANERTGYYVPKEIFDKYHLDDSAYINHCHFQMKELIEKYSPDLLWGDATWDYPSSYWRSKDLLYWILNNAPNKEVLAINDRWGNDAVHGGFVTTEYGTGAEKLQEGRPWEECRGIGYSFGYNRAESLSEYSSSTELIHSLINTVSNGGNLLLNIGPRADGTIPTIMEERLLQIGEWLSVNGEAIYETNKHENIALLKEQNKNIGIEMFLTQKEDVSYLHCTTWPDNNISIEGWNKTVQKISILGCDKKVFFSVEKGILNIALPKLGPKDASEAYVFKIE